jgi:hypothetical protein
VTIYCRLQALRGHGKDIHGVISHRGVPDARYKPIEFYTKGERKFYHLYKDPLEMNGEDNNPRYKKIMSDMK